MTGKQIPVLVLEETIFTLVNSFSFRCFFHEQECFRVSKTEQRKMRSRMRQALQTANLDVGEVQSVAVNDVAEKYTKKNIELHETEFFIPVRSTTRHKYHKLCYLGAKQPRLRRRQKRYSLPYQTMQKKKKHAKQYFFTRVFHFSSFCNRSSLVHDVK